ncbi:hypothetical protein JTE90_003673 [Oedothorax gibbosus]|uniref:Uncharacterized protein n=1 Tax=Oedothorax gibbosus TaxID=931172 RepID=A0AAV6VU09_9ARAC|nr:hypothetical protein JTE90_003673 [Oedothorax gibbosus]
MQRINKLSETTQVNIYLSSFHPNLHLRTPKKTLIHPPTLQDSSTTRKIQSLSEDHKKESTLKSLDSVLISRQQSIRGDQRSTPTKTSEFSQDAGENGAWAPSIAHHRKGMVSYI